LLLKKLSCCYDEENGVSAMAYTTSRMLACVVDSVVEKVVEGVGLIPLERLGENPDIAMDLWEKMRGLGIAPVTLS